MKCLNLTHANEWIAELEGLLSLLITEQVVFAHGAPGDRYLYDSGCGCCSNHVSLTDRQAEIIDVLSIDPPRPIDTTAIEARAELTP